MWIRTTRAATVRLYDPELDVSLEFSENGTVQVEADVGEQLCERYEAIEPYERDGE